MLYRLAFKGGLLAFTEAFNIDCPNQYGGISDIVFEPTEAIWFQGEHAGVHVTTHGKIGVDFTALREVRSRSNDYETDEPWITEWTYAGGNDFVSRYWEATANNLRNMLKATPHNDSTPA